MFGEPNNEECYPKLARAAMRVYSIPATSTPLERTFSKAGFIVSKTRTSVLPNNVDKLVFLSHNMRRLRAEGKKCLSRLLLHRSVSLFAPICFTEKFLFAVYLFIRFKILFLFFSLYFVCMWTSEKA